MSKGVLDDAMRLVVSAGAAVSLFIAALQSSAGEAPRINGASIYGVRPGSPIIYRLPVTGTRPLELSAKGLPEGVTFDAAKGILGGSTLARGTNIVEFAAKNADGAATKRFRLVVGDEGPKDITVTWEEAGLSGRCAARDCWAGRDLGEAEGSFTAKAVPQHGTRVVRFSRR